VERRAYRIVAEEPLGRQRRTLVDNNKIVKVKVKCSLCLTEYHAIKTSSA
jgi:hypothetical protein